MLRTKLMTTMLLTAAATGSVACGAPSVTVTNVEVLDIAPPSCVVPGRRLEPWLLDIAVDDFDGLVLPLRSALRYDNGASPRTWIPDEVSLFYATEGALAAFPTDASSMRQRALGTPVLSRPTPTQPVDDVVAFFTAIDRNDVTALRNEPVVSAALTSTADRLRLDLHVQVNGVAFDATETETETLLALESTFITVPVDLCRGCLTSACVAAGDDGACFAGVDRPSTACPAE